jgi:hypothetical protein
LRLSYLLDAVAIAAVASGLGARFGWWLAAVVAGTLVLLANYVRASS